MARNKAERFIDLANKRVNKAIKDIQLIGNLSNRQNYEYTDEQARKILRALQSEIDLLKQEFLSKEHSAKSDFKL